jgi:hypothetical protein
VKILATQDTERTEEDREKIKSGWITGDFEPPVAHPGFLSLSSSVLSVSCVAKFFSGPLS